jgi:hypothetical protein
MASSRCAEPTSPPAPGWQQFPPATPLRNLKPAIGQRDPNPPARLLCAARPGRCEFLAPACVCSTEYAAIPKTPVIESIAPSMPSTPNDKVAMRGANIAPFISLFQVWMKAGSPASRSRSLPVMAAASCCGSWLDRITIHVLLLGDCRVGEILRAVDSQLDWPCIFRLRRCPTPRHARHSAT